jgi:hypothetical protein
MVIEGYEHIVSCGRLGPEFAFPTRLLSVGNANSDPKHPHNNEQESIINMHFVINISSWGWVQARNRFIE